MLSRILAGFGLLLVVVGTIDLIDAIGIVLPGSALIALGGLLARYRVTNTHILRSELPSSVS